MHKDIATDVPAWLVNILKKISWDNLAWGMPTVIEMLVNNECRNLPKKSADYSVVDFFTTTPSTILETINLVDFNALPKIVEHDFRTRVENAVRTHLEIQL